MLRTLIASLSALACLASSPAKATFIVDILQEGPDVVAIGSGSLNLTGLTQTAGSSSAAARVQPDLGVIALGFSSNIDGYTGFAGPATFGGGGTTAASTESGVRVTMQATNPSFPPTDNLLYVPAGYASGGALSDMATFSNETLSGLGLTVGTYVWSWGMSAGVVSDRFVINVGTVPEPSSLSLVAVGLAAATMRRPRAVPPIS